MGADGVEVWALTAWMPDPERHRPEGMEMAEWVSGMRPDGDEDVGVRLSMGEDPREIVPSDGLCKPETACKDSSLLAWGAHLLEEKGDV